MHNSLLLPRTFDDLIELSPCKDMINSYKTFQNPQEKKAFNGTDTWAYNVNEYGYRNSWNLESSKPRIGYFGCSNTFGIGVPDDLIFSSLVEQQLSDYEHYNFGAPGASCRRILKIFAVASQLINLDYAIFSFPSPTRQLIVIDNYYNDLNVSYRPPQYSKKVFNGWAYFRDYNTVAEELIDIVDTAILWANKSGVKIILNCWQFEYAQLLLDNYNDRVFPGIRMFDHARDNGHPGPKSHEIYAKTILEKLKTLDV
jgi:hypothetical protein